MMSNPTFGKLREPFLRCVNLAHAFNASAQAGYYALDCFYLDHVEEPLRSPSVFNFYQPSYSPPGMLNEAGLFAPEFQIINAGSAITAPNYFFSAIRNNDLHRWGSGVPAQTVRLNIDQELAMIVPPNGNINDNVPDGTCSGFRSVIATFGFRANGWNSLAPSVPNNSRIDRANRNGLMAMAPRPPRARDRPHRHFTRIQRAAMKTRISDPNLGSARASRAGRRALAATSQT